MKDKIIESKQIASKFLDGDMSSNNEWEQLVSDQEAKPIYERYQMIGELMRQEPVAFDVSIADSVMDSLENEATVLAPRPRNTQTLDIETGTEDNVISLPKRFGKQIGGFAIAASVALVALMNFSDFNQVNDEANASLNLAVAGTNVSLDRAELRQAHQLFTEMSQLKNAGLPIIQTVSNQKAVAIQVPLKNSNQLNSDKIQEEQKPTSEQEAKNKH